MGCQSCGSGAKAQVPSVPYTFKLPDGTSVTVASKVEERQERDRYFVRERKKAQQAGFTVTR